MNLQEAMNSEEIAKKFEKISSVDEAVNILKEYGVETTEEELTAMFPKEEGELTDDNLENVSGGFMLIATLPLAAYALWKTIKKIKGSGIGHSGGGRRG